MPASLPQGSAFLSFSLPLALAYTQARATHVRRQSHTTTYLILFSLVFFFLIPQENARGERRDLTSDK
ncbi:hypothetical protein GQ53DRAFT_747029 [Thozetella sp. PMI_491]|nr:hypothetical protein GQ53DRAFT_747029 [Thozetella sp. PMI_491]